MGHFYFVRHGQTIWNVENKICGATDIALTEFGHQQAVETGEKILKEGIQADEILYSPLVRAADTEAEQEKANVTADEIDAKFNAIYSLITDELGDIADKEKLMSNCTAAMEKAERSMLYRGVSLERAKELDSRGLLKEKSNAQINAMADEQEKLRNTLQGHPPMTENS